MSLLVQGYSLILLLDELVEKGVCLILQVVLNRPVDHLLAIVRVIITFLRLFNLGFSQLSFGFGLRFCLSGLK